MFTQKSFQIKVPTNTLRGVNQKLMTLDQINVEFCPAMVVYQPKKKDFMHDYINNFLYIVLETQTAFLLIPSRIQRMTYQSLFSSSTVGPSDQSQVIKLSSKNLCPLSHLSLGFVSQRSLLYVFNICGSLELIIKPAQVSPHTCTSSLF